MVLLPARLSMALLIVYRIRIERCTAKIDGLIPVAVLHQAPQEDRAVDDCHRRLDAELGVLRLHDGRNDGQGRLGAMRHAGVAQRIFASNPASLSNALAFS